MAPNLNLVPNIKTKVLLILAVLAVATGGLFEQRTKVTLNDGTVITGKEIDPADDAPVDDSKLILERASGYIQTVDRADIADTQWMNIEVNLNLGLDLRGGTSLRYRLDFEKDNVDLADQDEVLGRTVETFQTRLDKLGVKEVSVYRSGADEILVELPGVTMEESESYEKVVGSLGSLQFLIGADTKSTVNVSDQEKRVRDHLRSITDAGNTWSRRTDLSAFDVTGRDGIVYRWFPYSEKAVAETPSYAEFPFILLEVNPAYNFTGEDLAGTSVTTDERMFPALGFSMKGTRASDFGKFTGSNLGRQMAIVLDNEVASAPELKGTISSSGQISGGANGFSNDELKSLRTTLESGSLKVHPVMLSKATIGPSLGKESITRGLQAGLIAGLLVLMFMLFYYRTAGIISGLTLLIGIYILMGGLGFLDATLTLPGIAGILLTLGMAVDQNILINERIREEREKGKTLGQAVKNGYERAFVTIVDAQATTFIAGFILFRFGTGPIKGFAVTLMLGILTTMFAALVGSKTIFAIGLAKNWFTDLKLSSLIGETKIQFTKYLRPCLIASAAALTAGMAFFAMQYEEMKGLDFAGGFQAQIRTRTPMAQAEIKGLLEPKFPNAIVVTMVSADGQTDGAKTTDFMIKIKSTAEEREAEASGAQDQRGEYVKTLRSLLSGKLIDDGIAIGAGDIKPQPDGRALATVTLNFAAPIAQDIVLARLNDAVTVRSVAPAAGSTSPTTSYVVEILEASASVTPELVRAEIAPTLSDLPGEVRLSEPLPASQFIGGRVGKELRNSAIKAIVLAILAILIYIRVRFHDVNYGIAACVAVAHDVTFGLGAITVAHVIGLVDVDLDLSMIGAFLTIIGYSLNDTIVIFDRVRENIPRMNKPLEDVINTSVNQTLSRTMLTSITTFIAVVVLFVLNYGQRNVLEGFSFAIMIGIIVGTYSTIFIASPMLVWLTKRAEAQKAAAAKTATA